MPEGKSGTVEFRGWRLWYGVIGDLAGNQVPLICVPGGPGVPHNALASLATWAPPHRPIVLYDPSGSGRSDRPRGVHWDLDLFIEELITLRTALRIERCFLFGTSFGGLVCLSYLLRKPQGVAGIVLTGTTPSMPASRAAIRRQIEALPPATRDALEGRATKVAYVKAYFEWVAKHMCRVPLPKALNEAMAQSNVEAMHVMKGTDPIGFGGTLQDLDIRDRLPEITVPALLTCGRHDALYPEIFESMHRAMPNSRTIVFAESSHMPQYEEPAAFMPALFGFLDELDPPR